jgi:hypothetical protein
MSTPDLIATLGVSILLIGFLLQIMKIINAQSSVFSLLNLLGAGLAGISAYMISFMPFVILEGVWVVVSIFNLVQNLKQNHSRETK